MKDYWKQRKRWTGSSLNTFCFVLLENPMLLQRIRTTETETPQNTVKRQKYFFIISIINYNLSKHLTEGKSLANCMVSSNVFYFYLSTTIKITNFKNTFSIVIVIGLFMYSGSNNLDLNIMYKM